MHNGQALYVSSVYPTPWLEKFVFTKYDVRLHSWQCVCRVGRRNITCNTLIHYQILHTFKFLCPKLSSTTRK